MKSRKKKTASGADCKRSVCPIANALDLIGDKWTLLVVRDSLFLGKRQFGEFIQSPERIPSNILAERLKRLEKAGLVTRKPYQDRPLRYEYHLTPKGADLFPVLKEMVRWAGRHIPGTARPRASVLKKFEKQVNRFT